MIAADSESTGSRSDDSPGAKEPAEAQRGTKERADFLDGEVRGFLQRQRCLAESYIQVYRQLTEIDEDGLFRYYKFRTFEAYVKARLKIRDFAHIRRHLCIALLPVRLFRGSNMAQGALAAAVGLPTATLEVLARCTRERTDLDEVRLREAIEYAKESNDPQVLERLRAYLLNDEALPELPERPEDPTKPKKRGRKKNQGKSTPAPTPDSRCEDTHGLVTQLAGQRVAMEHDERHGQRPTLAMCLRRRQDLQDLAIETQIMQALNERALAALKGGAVPPTPPPAWNPPPDDGPAQGPAAGARHGA